MKIATWNVNSINARLPRILEWFETAKPDIAVLQEIKCVDEKFPIEAFETAGYRAYTHGQKTYNGVAMLSKHPVEDLQIGLPGDPQDQQARYIEAFVTPVDSKPFRLGGLYLPNGNPAPGPKFDYKLAWMERLHTHAAERLKLEEDFILAGDYNIIPQEEDTHNATAWQGDALFRPESHAAYRALVNLGFVDALRYLKDTEMFYTFWDYQGGAWPKDHGIRIDHCLVSPQAADRLTGGGVDKHVRDPRLGAQSVKPSDHVPVWITLA